MAKARCPQCGARVQESAGLCPRCGASLPGPAARESESAAGRMVRCPDCGREISRRAVACPHCGAPIAPARIAYVKPDWGIEWTSEARVGSWPLVHVAFGRKDGRLRTAKGVIAIGQFARGVFVVAQFGWAYVFAFGQFVAAPVAIGQFALAVLFALGQFAGAYVAIGQFAVGYYVLAQIGFGSHAWTTLGRDALAVEFFRTMWQKITGGW